MENDKMKLADIFRNVIFTIKLVFKINKRLVFAQLFMFVLQIALPLINMYFMRNLINAITNNEEIKQILISVVAMAVVNLCITLINRIVSSYISIQTQKTTIGIKYHLGVLVSRMKYSDIEQPKIKNFISLAESNSFTEIITSATNIISALINLLTYSTIVLFVQPWIVLLLVVSLVLQFVFSKMKLNFSYKWEVAQMPSINKTSYFEEVLLGREYGKELRINRLKEWMIGKINKQYTEVDRKIIVDCNKQGGIIDFFSSIINLIETVSVYLLLAYKVVFSNMSLGDYSFYLGSTFNLTSALRNLMRSISDILENGLFAKNFRYLTILAETAEAEGSVGKLNNTNKVEIEFRNVSFKYPGTDKFILKNLSFKINSGEKVSVIGLNGAGKTTIVKLICKFYTPTEGEIFVNGISLNEISQKEIAEKMSIVFQDFKLFSFSIAENVAVETKFDENRVRDCLERGGVLEKVKTLSDGINTYLTKDFNSDGIELSGGEGQKVAIARAFYKNAQFIILDEPTSALDPIAENYIYKRFEELTAGRSAIYISHRLTTTRFTDKIIVLSEGTICECGTHDELMKIENGIYYNIFMSQAQYYL